MPEITPSQLITINLKFGSQSRPLKSIAFADLASNALFFLKREVTAKDVAKEVARLIGIPGIDEGLVSKALNDLFTDGKVKRNSGKWQLTDDTRKAIEAESEKSELALQEVLKNHFPGNIESAVLRGWFLEASSDFFGFNGAEWVKSILKSGTSHFAKPKTIRDLLTGSIKTYKLNEHKDILIEAYDAFLSSENAADLQYVMNLCFAMFSAQLVSADVGADPITVEEIRGATFILDTNTLFPVQLDSHRLAKSIQALALALIDIEAELIFLHTTKQEYLRVYIAKKGQIEALFREYPPEVVLDAESDFIETGVSRGCKTLEDFERFLSTIRTPPSQLSVDLKIKERDDLEIDAETKRAEEDKMLKGCIQKHCLKLRGKWDPRPKSESALRHDAALIRVTEQLRKDKKKTWILSLDRGVRACAVERTGTHGIPLVFMLDGLIQILAVHSGGPKRNAADFAPLLTSIILNRCSPSERTYTLDDLRWLQSLHQRVVDFSPDDIKKIASIVTRYRLAGANYDDPKLQLAVNRAYQEKQREYSREIEQAHERARGAETRESVAREELKSVNENLSQLKKNECLREERCKLRRALYWRVPLALFVGVGIYFMAAFAFPVKPADWLPFASGIISFLGLFSFLLIKPFKQFLAGRSLCHKM